MWSWLEKQGVVSDECLPYESGDNKTISCSTYSKCKEGKSLLYYAKQGMSVAFEDVDSIKLEIMTNGPITSGFYVFKDFKSYKGGIYTQNS